MIREATHDDIELIVMLCKKFHLASPFRDVPFSPNQCRMTIQNAIQDEDCCVLFSGDGFIAGAVRHTPFSAERIACEIAWFSEGVSGIKLLIAYEKWVMAQNVNVSIMSVIDNDLVQGERVCDILERRGYKLSEQTFIKQV